jgi:hypothetical protein
MKLTLCAIVLSAGAFGVSLFLQQALREGGGSGAQQDPARQPPFQVMGQLTADEPIDRARPGRFFQAYPVRLKAGQSYTVDLHSVDIDSYLRIEDEAGNTFAEDDDSGPALDARILFRPSQSGIYRIVVTTFAPGETGWYVLNVR